jgi:hypothetical protein
MMEPQVAHPALIEALVKSLQNHPFKWADLALKIMAAAVATWWFWRRSMHWERINLSQEVSVFKVSEDDSPDYQLRRREQLPLIEVPPTKKTST